MKVDNNRFLVIAAPSGAGKGTLIAHLLKSFRWLQLSVSATTRKIRPGETEGVHYHYLSPEEFQRKIDNSEFIEWEEFYGGVRYGTLKSEVERIISANKVPVFEVEVKGALSLKKIYKDRAELVFVNAPSLIVIEQRLRARATEDEATIQTRMKRAEYEMSLINQFDHLIMNDDLDQAKKDIEALILRLFPEYEKFVADS